MGDAATPTITRRLSDALYTEAMLLADELRAYLDGPAVEARSGLPPGLRVLFACETLNASTRVMQVTARLLAHRAGEPLQEALLDQPGVPAPEMLALLPEDSRRLIGAGVDLYERVRRLDAGTAALPPPPSPARALFDRLERAF